MWENALLFIWAKTDSYSSCSQRSMPQVHLYKFSWDLFHILNPNDLFIVGRQWKYFERKSLFLAYFIFVFAPEQLATSSSSVPYLEIGIWRGTCRCSDANTTNFLVFTSSTKCISLIPNTQFNGSRFILIQFLLNLKCQKWTLVN